jgi:hypothetical protein
LPAEKLVWSGVSAAAAAALHYDALALFRPGVVLLVGRVDQGVALLVLLHVLAHPVDILVQN